MKTEKEIKDSKLSNYKFEINDDANDGWTKEHYRKMYELRLEKLQKEEKEKEQEEI